MSVFPTPYRKEAPEVLDKYADDQAYSLDILIQSVWAEVCKSLCFILFLK